MAASRRAGEKAERRHRSAIARLRGRNAEQRRLVADVSHGLKTPITTIIACAESLGAGGRIAPGRRARLIRTILRSARWLGTLAEELLQLSIVGVGRAARAETIALAPVIARFAADLRPRLSQEGLSLSVRVRPGLRVRCDRRHLELVFQSLCENAIHYSRPRGRIAVRAARRGREALVTITDDGVGIPREALSRIFLRHYRSPTARQLNPAGAGLGLAIVKAILEFNRGSIWVESPAGKGSAFHWTLPLAGRAPVSPRGAAASGA